VVRAEAVRWAGASPPLDLAFADPPYAFDAWGDLLAVLPAQLVVLESNRELDVGGAWTILRLKRYGGTVVTVAERLGGAS
jgi:16S rRNA G966 N2-methylase RsmD